MRAQPDRDDLKQFVETAASMNGRLIAERLQAKMVGTCLSVAALCLHGKMVCSTVVLLQMPAVPISAVHLLVDVFGLWGLLLV